MYRFKNILGMTYFYGKWPHELIPNDPQIILVYPKLNLHILI